MSDNDTVFFPAIDGYVLRSKVISTLYRSGFRKAADYCKALPVIPDVKPVVRGKWIWKPDKRWWECDQCGEKTTDACMNKPRANYCPWCGADMRGSYANEE